MREVTMRLLEWLAAGGLRGLSAGRLERLFAWGLKGLVVVGVEGLSAGGLERLASGGLEGLACGGLGGLAAAGFYIHFFGSVRGSVLAGTGIGFFSFAAFWQPGLWPWILAISACWMMMAGGIYRTRQWQELFLAGGTWLMACGFSCLWPGAAPLQRVAALALFEMAALYLLRRGRLYPLWMGTLLCLWLLAGFMEGMIYEERWQEQVMKAANFLVLGGIFVFQQIFCVRQEMKMRIWEETEGWKESEKREETRGKEESRGWEGYERQEEYPREQEGYERQEEDSREWKGYERREGYSRERKGYERQEEDLRGRQNGWEAEKKEKQSMGGEARDWRNAAGREYRRLQIFEHDFRHHLDMLGALYEEGNQEEARAYLEDLKQARLSGQGQKDGGEREISYIMLAKKEACRRAGIAFSWQIMGSPRGIAQTDMTALLLNLLDNAIRACEKVSEPRSIGIMLLARGNLWQVELVNTGRYEPRETKKDGAGKSRSRVAMRKKSERESQSQRVSGWKNPEWESQSQRVSGCKNPERESQSQRVPRWKKPEQEGLGHESAKTVHGIGLVSVRQIVEKYQGTFEIRQEGDSVVQKVILAGRFQE